MSRAGGPSWATELGALLAGAVATSSGVATAARAYAIGRRDCRVWADDTEAGVLHGWGMETPTIPTPSNRSGWPRPAGPPTLSSPALRHAQALTLDSPRRRPDPFSRLMFASVNLLYGRRGSLAKFLVLEHLARIPYQTWERVAQRAIARTKGRSRVARRIMDRVVEARAQQDNEQFHLLIIDELLSRDDVAAGRFRHRILPRLLAGPWHVFTWLLHIVRPSWSFRLNATFEDHAEHEYMRFVADHPELDLQPVRCDAAREYGEFASVGDLLRQIGHDERVHKLASLAAADELRSARDDDRDVDDDDADWPEAA